MIVGACTLSLKACQYVAMRYPPSIWVVFYTSCHSCMTVACVQKFAHFWPDTPLLTRHSSSGQTLLFWADTPLLARCSSSGQTLLFQPDAPLLARHSSSSQTLLFWPDVPLLARHSSSDQTLLFWPDAPLLARRSSSDQTLHFRPDAPLLARHSSSGQDGTQPQMYNLDIEIVHLKLYKLFDRAYYSYINKVSMHFLTFMVILPLRQLFKMKGQRDIISIALITQQFIDGHIIQLILCHKQLQLEMDKGESCMICFSGLPACEAKSLTKVA